MYLTGIRMYKVKEMTQIQNSALIKEYKFANILKILILKNEIMNLVEVIGEEFEILY